MAALSMASIKRSGASKKSSALLVGGVSSTMRSKRGSCRTSSTFSMAMYDCVPARLVET